MLFSKKDLFRIMIPLIAQQLLGILVGMIDSVMVSSAGEAAVSGVALVNTVDNLFFFAISAMATGGSVIVAQALGRKDYDYAVKGAKQVLYAVTSLAVVLSLIVVFFHKGILNLVYGSIEADVMESARRYMLFVAFSFPFLALYNSGAVVYQTMGKTVVTLGVSVVINIVNVIGNAVCIYGFKMGAAGAAVGTLIARTVGAFIIVYMAHNKQNPVHFEKLLSYRPDFRMVKEIFGIGIPNGIENSIFQIGKILTQSLISSMGTAVIAANSMASVVVNFHYLPGAVGSGMIAVVGRCIGAGEKEQAKKYARTIVGIAYLVMWAIVLATVVFRNQIIGLYDLSEFSSQLAVRMILLHSLFAATLWPVAFPLANAFRAAKDVRFTRVVSMICMWVFRVALAYVFALDTVSVFGLFSLPGLGMGAMGVWISMGTDWVVRAGIYLYHYFSDRWLRKCNFEPKSV